MTVNFAIFEQVTKEDMPSTDVFCERNDIDPDDFSLMITAATASMVQRMERGEDPTQAAMAILAAMFNMGWSCYRIADGA